MKDGEGLVVGVSWIGVEVQAGGGLNGTVEQVIHGGVVYDPLTESSIVAAEDDPVLVVGTKSGLRAAVAASEVISGGDGGGVPVQVGSVVKWPAGTGVVDMVVTSGEIPGVDVPLLGTKTAPAARVRLPGGERVAVTLAELTPAGTDNAEGPPAAVLNAVRVRGLQSWPGTAKTSLSREMWADARVKAFLAAAGGEPPDGYARDQDLLPGGGP